MTNWETRWCFHVKLRFNYQNIFSWSMLRFMSITLPTFWQYFHNTILYTYNGSKHEEAVTCWRVIPSVTYVIVPTLEETLLKHTVKSIHVTVSRAIKDTLSGYRRHWKATAAEIIQVSWPVIGLYEINALLLTYFGEMLDMDRNYNYNRWFRYTWIMCLIRVINPQFFMAPRDFDIFCDVIIPLSNKFVGYVFY